MPFPEYFVHGSQKITFNVYKNYIHYFICCGTPATRRSPEKRQLPIHLYYPCRFWYRLTKTFISDKDELNIKNNMKLYKYAWEGCKRTIKIQRNNMTISCAASSKDFIVVWQPPDLTRMQRMVYNNYCPQVVKICMSSARLRLVLKENTQPVKKQKPSDNNISGP